MDRKIFLYAIVLIAIASIAYVLFFNNPSEQIPVNVDENFSFPPKTVFENEFEDLMGIWSRNGIDFELGTIVDDSLADSIKMGNALQTVVSGLKQYSPADSKIIALKNLSLELAGFSIQEIETSISRDAFYNNADLNGTEEYYCNHFSEFENVISSLTALDEKGIALVSDLKKFETSYPDVSAKINLQDRISNLEVSYSAVGDYNSDLEEVQANCNYINYYNGNLTGGLIPTQ